MTSGIYKQIAHLLYTPFTGLGLYGGHRGERWLKNRIQIFKQFVIPSLLAQTNKNFILWISWRYEERSCHIVKEFKEYLDSIQEFKTFFTYAGVCFWDDKYNNDEALKRLSEAIHGSIGEILNNIGEAETILMTIQPSDDCYYSRMVDEVQKELCNNIDAVGYRYGYVGDYVNRRIAEWNPTTNPPFYTIKFKREIFIDPYKHMKFTGPYKSHEFVPDFLKYKTLETRGYLVGTHGENISTIFNHPFTQHEYLGSNILPILAKFGLENVPLLKLKSSLKKRLMRKLPREWQKRLRFIFGEKVFNVVYNWLRS